MKYGLFKVDHTRKGRNRYVRVSEMKYSSFEIAAFVWAKRIIEAKGRLYIRGC